MKCKHIWNDGPKQYAVCGICKRDNIINELLEENKKLKKTMTKVVDCYDLRNDLYSSPEVALDIIVSYVRDSIRD